MTSETPFYQRNVHDKLNTIKAQLDQLGQMKTYINELEDRIDELERANADLQQKAALWNAVVETVLENIVVITTEEEEDPDLDNYDTDGGPGR